MLKLALQPDGDRLSISLRLVVEDFTAKEFMKLVGDRSTTVRWLVGDWSPPSRKPLRLIGDQNQSRLVVCAFSKDWLRLILYGDRPIADLAATFVKPCRDLCILSAIVNSFSHGKVASSVGWRLMNPWRTADAQTVRIVFNERARCLWTVHWHTSKNVQAQKSSTHCANNNVHKRSSTNWKRPLAIELTKFNV